MRLAAAGMAVMVMAAAAAVVVVMVVVVVVVVVVVGQGLSGEQTTFLATYFGLSFRLSPLPGTSRSSHRAGAGRHRRRATPLTRSL